jgi:hypothetical protein
VAVSVAEDRQAVTDRNRTEIANNNFIDFIQVISSLGIVGRVYTSKNELTRPRIGYLPWSNEKNSIPFNSDKSFLQSSQRRKDQHAKKQHIDRHWQTLYNQSLLIYEPDHGQSNVSRGAMELAHCAGEKEDKE